MLLNLALGRKYKCWGAYPSINARGTKEADNGQCLKRKRLFNVSSGDKENVEEQDAFECQYQSNHKLNHDDEGDVVLQAVEILTPSKKKTNVGDPNDSCNRDNIEI